MPPLSLRRRALTGGLVLLALAASCLPHGQAWAQAPTAAADAAETRRLHALFERQWEENAQLLPEFATLRGDHRFGDRLADVSAEGLARRDAAISDWLAEARGIDAAKLSRSDRLSLELFIHNMQRFVEQRTFVGHRGMTLRALGGQ
jgi:uncharacterized protein (DUF885 family)